MNFNCLIHNPSQNQISTAKISPTLPQGKSGSQTRYFVHESPVFVNNPQTEQTASPPFQQSKQYFFCTHLFPLHRLPPTALKGTYKQVERVVNAVLML